MISKISEYDEFNEIKLTKHGVNKRNGNCYQYIHINKTHTYVCTRVFKLLGFAFVRVIE